MSQYNIVARTLQSLATSAAIEGEGYYDHLREESGELIEQRITPTDRQEHTVGEDVKETTAAVYLTSETERIAFCLGPNNDLRYYKFDNDGDEWKSDEPHSVPEAMKLHPKTQLAAGICGENSDARACVFYQNNQGILTCVSTGDLDRDLESWSFEAALTAAVKPVHGTYLQAVNSESDSLRLYYVSQDKFIHYVDYHILKQTDHKVEYANLDGPVKSFIVYRLDSSDEAFGIFSLGEDNSVYHYLPKEKTKFGVINANGDLVLENKDEFFLLHRTGHRGRGGGGGCVIQSADKQFMNHDGYTTANGSSHIVRMIEG